MDNNVRLLESAWHIFYYVLQPAGSVFSCRCNHLTRWTWWQMHSQIHNMCSWHCLILTAAAATIHFGHWGRLRDENLFFHRLLHAKIVLFLSVMLSRIRATERKSWDVPLSWFLMSRQPSCVLKLLLAFSVTLIQPRHLYDALYSFLSFPLL